MPPVCPGPPSWWVVLAVAFGLACCVIVALLVHYVDRHDGD